MKRNPPPPVIDSARALSYAFVDDIEYRRAGALYAGDKLIEHVPCLAICMNLGEDAGVALFHCDYDWNVIATSEVQTLEEAKERAERNYPSVGSRWVDQNVTVDEALKYYDAKSGGRMCSFCKKRPFEVWALVKSESATICNECVAKFQRDLRHREQ